MPPSREPLPGADSRSHLIRLAPVLLALAGLGASGFVFWSLRDRETGQARTALAGVAAKHVAAVNRAIEANLAQVQATYAFFAASDEVRTDEFGTFTRVSLENACALRALVWVEAMREGVRESFRVRYQEGTEAAFVRIGTQLEAALRDTFDRDESDGQLVILELSSSGSSSDDSRVLAVRPFHGNEKQKPGLIVGLLDVEELLTAGEAPPFPELSILVEDVTTSEVRKLGGSTTGEEPLHAAVFPVGSRDWRISATVPSGFLEQRATWIPWGALLLGLVATGLLVATVASVTSRGRIQRLVGRRTREIMAAYETLSAEAQQRQEAVKEKDRLEQRMRAIIDLVPDMIYVKDWFGRFMLANKATAEFYGTTVAALTASRNVDMNADPADPDETLKAERLLIEAGLSSVIKAIPLVDSEGRRRIHHQVKIPCTIFGEGKRTLLCISADITDQRYAEDSLRSQNRILGQLARGEDPKRVLESLTGMAEEIVPGMRCSVLVVGPERRHLHHCAAPSLPTFYNEAVDGLEIGPSAGSCGAAAHSGSRMVVQDVMTHPNWEPYRDLAHRAHIRACWSEPIRSSDGEVLGTFAMYYSVPRAPEPHEEELIEAMANLAGIAIERGRLQASS